jgi:ABC-type sulfate/molybdate transport systems ATPase subunit
MIEHSTGQFEQVPPLSTALPSDLEREVRALANTTKGALTIAIRRDLPGFSLDIAFSVPHGLTVLFGPSGSGKSLTLQSIAGLFPLDAAHIALDDMVWQDRATGMHLPPQQRHVGYVPQNYALFPHLTVEQNIAFGLKALRSGANRVSRKARTNYERQRVRELIDLMQLGGLERHRPAQLSGGQQQRVALARALATDPHLLLLDEPFSSLDAAVRETLREEMRAFHERVRVPILLVTHDAAEARMLADTIVVIQQGSVRQVGSPDQVFRSPRARSVADLVGMRTCWSGEVIDIADTIEPHPRPTPDTHKGYPYMPALPPASHRIATVSVEDRMGGNNRHEALILHASVPYDMPVAIGQTLELGIRTDELRLFAHDEQLRSLSQHEEPYMSLVSAEVIHVQPKGIAHTVTFLLAAGQTLDIPMITREIDALGIHPEARVTIGIPSSAVHVFTE